MPSCIWQFRHSLFSLSVRDAQPRPSCHYLVSIILSSDFAPFFSHNHCAVPTMSPIHLRHDDDSMDSDVESEGASPIEVEPTENSPLLPNDLPPDIVPPKSLQRRVLVICIIFLFIVEASQFIVEAPLQKIMEDIICCNYFPDYSLRMPQIQDRRCKDNEVQRILAMVRGWSLAFEMATRKLPALGRYHQGIDD